MCKRTAKALLAACALALAGPLGALSTDRDQPIEIEADFAELDDQRGVTVYSGNVIVTQGSMRLWGDKLTVNYSEDQELEQAYLEGEPARFRQRPDGRDEDYEGEAMQIEFHARESLLFLIDDAMLQQGGKLLSGHRITYDTERSILTARKATGAEQPRRDARDEPPKRIRVVIPPKKRD